MKYAERQAVNGTLANQAYFNSIQSTPQYTAVGTAIAVDGLTGRLVTAVADGVVKYQNIANSSAIGVTSASYAGRFADGRGV